MNYKIVLLAFVALFFSCSSEDNNTPTAVDPVVNTLGATIGQNGGVNLEGSYIPNDATVSETGFEYALDNQFTNTKVTVTAEASSQSEINYFIATGVTSGVTYYYRAYIRANNTTFYGSSQNFLSDGSVAPIIESISDDFGHIADTLEIRGRYFIDSNHQTSVTLSNDGAEIISINDTIIKCKVPTYINNIVNTVNVNIDNRQDSYTSFTLHAPTITSIVPITAAIGDIITINGDHFDIENTRNNVFFGNVPATVVESDRNYVKVIVPSAIENVSESISLQAQLQTAIYNQNFTLATPEITAISPLTATFREEVTITGDNFGLEIEDNRVFFGIAEATITYADPNTIKVLVPDDLESSSESIRIVAQLQDVITSQNFQLTPPEITNIPQSAFTTDEISIQGAYFHPVFDQNTITFENIESPTNDGDDQNLTSNVPLGPFPRRKATVRVQVLDLVAEYTVDLDISDKWVMMSNDLPFRFYRNINNAVVANNEAFVIAKEVDFTNETYYLWKFNPIDNSWEQSSLPFQPARGAATSNNNKIYVYTALADNAFWEYDPVAQQWTQKAAYTGARRDYATHFSINDDIYIGMGADFQPFTSIKYGDFYKYSPTTDSWTQIATFTYQNYFLRTETSTFTINGIAYVGNGATNTGMVDYWSYHPTTDQWIQIENFEDSRRYTASFSLNGFGYVTCGNPTGASNRNDSWKYDPSTGRWSQDAPVGRIPRGGHFSFSLNGKAYVGGGGIYSTGGTTGYDFYEFVP